MLKAKVKTLYCELLGEAIKQQLLEQEIPQNEVSYYFDDDIRLISAPAISQILKGKRNITLDTVDALQETLGLTNVKSVFFPTLDFCELLIIQLTELILTDGFRSTKQLFKEKENNIQQNRSALATFLYDFFPDFPEEETSYQIADSLTEWLIEFIALVAQL
ncbi:TPA: helix-turn-helix transcriptional regulator [Streptococcus suis]|nr:helix-turn-helix transcriptional regulator [Streptococcus suis]HEM4052635.1 helix-turn-helix transcriptional regulator [Streptococcus suis]